MFAGEAPTAAAANLQPTPQPAAAGTTAEGVPSAGDHAPGPAHRGRR